MTGYGRDELLFKTPRILQGPKSDPVMLRRLRETVERGEPFSGETVNYRKDGGEYYVEWDITPIRSEDGRIAYFLSIQRNVTARKAVEQRLQETFAELEKSRNDLLSILDELRIGTALTDESGRVVFLNAAAREIFPSENGAGHTPWRQLFDFSGEDAEAVHAMMAKSAAERTRISVHLERADGRRVSLEVDVRDDPRDVRRKVFFFYDVTNVEDLRRLLGERAQFHDLVGKSPAMQAVYKLIRAVARVDATVLIEGETGTGKELVARAIHFSSGRKDKPFLAVNCAGLTESLLASQLFGHKRGAFTGAIEDHRGLFEAANGGTLLLDEIGDIPMAVQNQLLRVVQEREIVRLGETLPRKIDVRLIAATHRNLGAEVSAGRFRQDLFYRIRVARIALPALRQRREDIPALAASFLGQFSAASGKRVTGISQEALRLLMDYDWPGNVRELRSAIEFTLIHCAGNVIQTEDLPPEVFPPGEAVPADAPLDERSRFLQALDRSRGNRALAARLLGISRATLYRRLADLKIDPENPSSR
jgi:PAS domain S-box-containing protein